jgi:alginate O-acetyltransferase complex protein AlgI
MVFSDPVFLFAFLPTCLVMFWAGAWRIRNAFLIVIGAAFYLWGGGAFIVLLAASIIGNHSAACLLSRWRFERRTAGRRLVTVVVTANAVSLGLWKYGGFAVGQVSSVLESVGLRADFTLQLALPIAISFYTFQCISYVVDVWRGTAAPAPRLTDFAAYVLLFPHLIAGPIVRYADIEADLLSRPSSRFDDFVAGAPRFFWGLGKKVLVADQVAAIADRAFALPDNRMTFAVAWIGVLAYAVQIYFDFSGYSDMAIGLARMFGFHFPENFNRPYSSVSVTDFWRRWHMSLSTWFRDYLYIPLGGNRKAPGRTYANLGAVFLLTGIWHGANWTFFVWGCFHGACLIVERLTGRGTIEPDSWVALRRLITFALVCVGWALFRAGTISQGLNLIHAMLTPQGFGIPAALDEVLTRQRLFWLAVGLAVVAMPPDPVGRRISLGAATKDHLLRYAAVAGVGPIACIYALSSTFSPFLYFQF